MKRTSAWRSITTIGSSDGIVSLREAKARQNERELTRKEEREFIKILANRMLAESMRFKESPASIGFSGIGGIQ
jgi:hypothetical protein